MKYLWFLLLFHTLFIPVAISLSEGSGFLLAVIAAGCLIRCRPKADIVPKSLLLPIALFVAYAVVLSISGLQPEGSYEKLYRFLSFGVVFAIPFLVCRQEDPKRALAVVVGTYLLGVVVLGLTDAIRIPVELKQGVSLFDTGNMRDPQFYMTAILLLSGVATFFPGPWLRWKWLVLFIYVAGLVLQFKRGSWLATFAGGALISVLRKKWSIIAVMILIGLSALLLPSTRARIAQLSEVTKLTTGGRYALWTEVAPSLIQDYRWGIGFKQSSYELLRSYTEHIQPGLDHLHNNILQLQVELGWGGLFLWILIQLAALRIMFDNIVGAKKLGQDELHPIAVGVLAAFAALHLNGMVEYNFGDTEIMFLYTWLMGVAIAMKAVIHSASAMNQESAPADGAS